jgi:hypothetical protein
MTTEERAITVELEDGTGDRVLVIVDDTVTDEQVAEVRDTLERTARAMHARAGVAVLGLAAAFARMNDTLVAAVEPTERAVHVLTCAAAEVPDFRLSRAERPLPGPIPSRVVRRAMRGRGWQR